MQEKDTFIHSILWIERSPRQTRILSRQKPEHLMGLSPSVDSESSSTSGSPAPCSKSSQSRANSNDLKDGRRKSISRMGDDYTIIDSFPERTQAGDLFGAAVGSRHLPPVSGILSINI